MSTQSRVKARRGKRRNIELNTIITRVVKTQSESYYIDSHFCDITLDRRKSKTLAVDQRELIIVRNSVYKCKLSPPNSNRKHCFSQ